MERFLSHIPQTVAPHHRHDHLLLCLVAIGEGEKHVGRLRLLGILVVADADAVDAFVALLFVVGKLLQYGFHLLSVSLGHGIGLQLPLIETVEAACRQAVVVDLGRSGRQFALVDRLLRLVGARPQEQRQGESPRPQQRAEEGA